MINHESVYGQVCWFCGHRGWRTRAVGAEVYRACDECRRMQAGGSAEATQEAAREARTQDLRMMEEFNLTHQPQYWTAAEYTKMKLLSRQEREGLAWKEYVGEDAAVLHEKARQNAREYAARYYKAKQARIK